MTFQLKVAHPLRLAESTDGEAIAERFLTAIGYIPPGTGQRLEGGVRSSAGFKLFYHCLAAFPSRSWAVSELVVEVGATPATVYRHLLRLRELGLVAEETQQRYRLWHYSLVKAWEVVEYHARLCQRDYTSLIEDLELHLGTGSDPATSQTHDQEGLMLAAGPHDFRFNLSELSPLPPEMREGETLKETLLANLLQGCGFLEPRSGELLQRIPYKLFSKWLLDRRDRIWTADELATALSTSRPTVYRHLNRLEGMGWVEKVVLKEGHPRITGFRLKGGSLKWAWESIESELDLGLQGYRKAINQLAGLAARV